MRSKSPSPSGGGQQCCYHANELLVGLPAGGTVDKCHSGQSCATLIKMFCPGYGVERIVMLVYVISTMKRVHLVR